MLIRELEVKTGLERATIRFYEREGFIQPIRHSNGYREYTAEDCENLLKIKLLRKLGISLERIRDLQQGRADFSQSLTEQINRFEEQIQAAQRAKSICERMRRDSVSYRTLDAAYYLKLFEEPAMGSTKIAASPVPEFHARMYLERHPFRRYIARLIDLNLLIATVHFLFFFVLRFRFAVELLEHIITIGCVLLSIPLNALLLSRFGTTPGKWLMGIRVLSCNGNHMSFADAKNREWNVLRYGYGFHLPIYTYIRLIKSYKEYINTYENEWYGDSEIIYEDWTKFRKIMAAIVAVIYVILVLFTGFDKIKPKYRGENITISQFSKNYNYIYNVLNDGQGLRLATNGEWQMDNDVIYVGFEQLSQFQYEQEGEYISTIRYEAAYPYNFGSLPNQCIVAAVSMTAAQNDIGYFELFSFIKQLQKLEQIHSENRSGEILLEDIIRVSWNEEIDDEYSCKFMVEVMK